MCDFDPQLLSAYHDDELEPDARARVDAHLADCDDCAATVLALRNTFNLFAHASPENDLTPTELARLHDAIDDATADAPLLRLGTGIGAIAASILIVSCAWLTELPQKNSGNSGGAGAGGTQLVRLVRPEPWEQLAMFRPTAVDSIDASTGDTTRFADARLADWMLDGLGQKLTATQTDETNRSEPR